MPVELPPLPATLLDRAPPPARVRYARTGHAGAFDLPRVLLEEDWGAPRVEGDLVCFRRVTRDVTTAPRVVEDALVTYGPEGLCDAGIHGPDGVLTRWTPPQRVLPAQPVAGASWTATHTRGEATSTRSVSLVACPDHPGCLVSVAETRRPDGVLVLRMHYGAGEGFTGYEALIQAAGRPTVRTWTEALTVQPRPPGPLAPGRTAR